MSSKKTDNKDIEITNKEKTENKKANAKQEKKSEDTKPVKEKNNRKKDQTGSRIILTTLCMIAVMAAIIFGGVYMVMVHGPKNMTEKVVKAYDSGDGIELVRLLSKDYKEFFNEKIKYQTIEDVYQNYIDEFRKSMKSKVGEVKSISGEIDEIHTASNVDEYKDKFAAEGIKHVKSYKEINMTWTVKGEKGTVDQEAIVYILKDKNGWHFDYIYFPGLKAVGTDEED